METLIIVSGGIDSTTLAYYLKGKGDNLHFLTFDYGQKHKKEIDFAKYHAGKLESDITLVDVSFLGKLLNSSLTSDIVEIPLGEYTKENMSSTVVPNRNSIMINIAYGIAISRNYDRLALGIHSGDHYIYPDCGSDFIQKTQVALESATEKYIEIYTPFIHKTKTEIVEIGLRLDVDYDKTWSCYRGLDTPCNQCGTCIERNKAILTAKKRII